ncbi:MAG: alpha/beta fold hydrolase [Armatimonadetes bacterium]|nr:alpha/beta fold hydrolase [Armatimonadota bacterium]
MPNVSIYRSPAGEAEVMALYESELARLPIPYESRMVDTRFGPTHVLVAGPEDAPPVVTLHGVHFGGPFNLELWFPLTQECRVYAPDTVGQPGRSAQTRPAPRDNNYGKWVADVLDGLGLDRAALVGVSFGAGILLDAAAYCPERISQAVLVVPGGLTRGSILMVFELLIPFTLYRFFPSRDRLLHVLRPFAAEPDETFLQFFGAVIRHVQWNVAGPGPFTREDLQGFRAPTLVLLARDDAFVPVDQAVRRAEQIIPNLGAVEVFEGPHIPTRQAQRFINDKSTGVSEGDSLICAFSFAFAFTRGHLSSLWFILRPRYSAVMPLMRMDT